MSSLEVHELSSVLTILEPEHRAEGTQAAYQALRVELLLNLLATSSNQCVHLSVTLVAAATQAAPVLELLFLYVSVPIRLELLRASHQSLWTDVGAIDASMEKRPNHMQVDCASLRQDDQDRGNCR